MATTPTANTHQCLKNGNKAGQMQWHLTSTDMNKPRMKKERCKMIEERTFYHDDNGLLTQAQIRIFTVGTKNFVEIEVEDDGTNAPLWLNFDSETAKAFARDILRKVEQIERDQE